MKHAQHLDNTSSFELEGCYGLGYKIISKNGYNENIEQEVIDHMKFIPYLS